MDDALNKSANSKSEASESINKVSLLEILSQDYESILAGPENIAFDTQDKTKKLIETLNELVERYIASPNTKWKSREAYRHIRYLQKIKEQCYEQSKIVKEIEFLIDRLNMYTFYQSDENSGNEYFGEEEQYWEELTLQETDPTYESLEYLQELQYLKELDSATILDKNSMIDLQFDDPVEFCCKIAKAIQQDDYDYWHHMDELIKKEVPIDIFVHAEEEELTENKIQSDPNFAILDTYRDSLLFLDSAPDDKIKVVFWQSDFEKFTRYCSENGLNTMLQLFDKNLSELYGFGFNHTRIQQIADIMESWAEKVLNPNADEEEIVSADSEYDEFLSMFFESCDDDSDEDENEDEVDEKDVEDDEDSEDKY